MWSHMGEGQKGTILHALDMGFRLFWFFCQFFWVISCFQWSLSSISCILIHQNTFLLQKSGKFNGKVFWQIVIMPKPTGTCFQRWEHVCRCSKVELKFVKTRSHCKKWSKPGGISSSQLKGTFFGFNGSFLPKITESAKKSPKTAKLTKNHPKPRGVLEVAKVEYFNLPL